MNERQRMMYTEALGITTFVPRRALALVPEPKQCLLPVAMPVETGQESSSQASSAGISRQAAPSKTDLPSSRAASVIDALPSSRVTAQSEQKAARFADNTASLTSSEAESAPSAAFSLHIWQVANELLIIDSHQRGEALPTHRLLANILSACAFRDDQVNAAETLLWPPANSRKNSYTDWPAAEEFVNAFLDARLQQRPAQQLWLFGESACQAVLGHTHAAHAYQRIESEVFSLSIATMPSLAHLLHHPEEKRDLWLFLLSLLP